jgi:hypothetical protein
MNRTLNTKNCKELIKVKNRGQTLRRRRNGGIFTGKRPPSGMVTAHFDSGPFSLQDRREADVSLTTTLFLGFSSGAILTG